MSENPCKQWVGWVLLRVIENQQQYGCLASAVRVKSALKGSKNQAHPLRLVFIYPSRRKIMISRGPLCCYLRLLSELDRLLAWDFKPFGIGILEQGIRSLGVLANVFLRFGIKRQPGPDDILSLILGDTDTVGHDVV